MVHTRPFPHNLPFLGCKKLNKNMMICMAYIVQVWSTSLPNCGNGGLSTTCGWVLSRARMATCLFYYTYVSFVSKGKLGNNPIDVGLMCLTPCGHKGKSV